MSARHDLAAFLSDAVPATWKVLDDPPTSVDRIDDVLVFVEPVGVSPWRTTQALAVRLAVSVLVPEQIPAKADDALDDALLTVTGVLDAIPALETWDAERRVFGDVLHGYFITTTIVTPRPS